MFSLFLTKLTSIHRTFRANRKQGNQAGTAETFEHRSEITDIYLHRLSRLLLDYTFLSLSSSPIDRTLCSGNMPGGNGFFPRFSNRPQHVTSSALLFRALIAK